MDSGTASRFVRTVTVVELNPRQIRKGNCERETYELVGRRVLLLQGTDTTETRNLFFHLVSEVQEEAGEMAFRKASYMRMPAPDDELVEAAKEVLNEYDLYHEEKLYAIERLRRALAAQGGK
jgi:hypothetical protein